MSLCRHPDDIIADALIVFGQGDVTQAKARFQQVIAEMVIPAGAGPGGPWPVLGKLACELGEIILSEDNDRRLRDLQPMAVKTSLALRRERQRRLVVTDYFREPYDAEAVYFR